MAGIQLNAQRIRFACDTSKPFGGSGVTNLINGTALAMPSGSALQFEILFYFQQLIDANLLDLSIYSEIVLALQDTSDPHSGTIYYQGSIVAANFNAAATVETWNNSTAASAHITLAVPSAQNIVPPANTSYWIVIYGVSTDAAADDILLFAANINGQDSGIPQGVPTLPQYFKAGTKLSFICGDGLTRDLQLGAGPAGVGWITTINQAGYNGVGQAIFSLFCTDGLWRDLSLQLEAGEYVLAINQNGHS
jgi:hypothetical protein